MRAIIIKNVKLKYRQIANHSDILKKKRKNFFLKIIHNQHKNCEESWCILHIFA